MTTEQINRLSRMDDTTEQLSYLIRQAWLHCHEYEDDSKETTEYKNRNTRRNIGRASLLIHRLNCQMGEIAAEIAAELAPEIAAEMAEEAAADAE